MICAGSNPVQVEDKSISLKKIDVKLIILTKCLVGSFRKIVCPFRNFREVGN